MPPVKAAIRGAPRDHLRGDRDDASPWPRSTRRSASRPAAPGGCSRSSRWTLAGAVLISGFVALTLSPMMCSKLLRHQERHNFLYRWIEAALNGLTRATGASLRGALTVKAGGRAGRGAGGGVRRAFLFKQLPSELSPIEDRGTIVALGIAPEGSTAGLHRPLRQADGGRSSATRPFVERFFTVDRLFRRDAGHQLRAPGGLGRAAGQAAGHHQEPVSQAVRASRACSPSPPTRRRLGQSPIDKPVQFVLQTSQPYEVLQAGGRPDDGRRPAESRAAEPRQRPQAQQAAAQGRRSTARRRRCSGIDVETIGRTVETMLGGRQVTRFKRDGKQYDVIVQLKDVDRTNPDDLREIFVRSAATAAWWRCRTWCTIEETVAPKELNHFNKLRAATLTATLAPGYSMGEALSFLDDEAAKLPPGDRHRPQRPEPRVPQLDQRPLRHASCWRWPSSIWCWRPSSRAGSTRRSSC